MIEVEITVTERVIYSRILEMTEAEFREWDDKLGELKGSEYDKQVEQLTAKYIRRDDRDFQEADDLELRHMRVLT
jgi:hypothetical protein